MAEQGGFSRDLMLGGNKAEAQANMAWHAKSDREAILNLRQAVIEILYMIEMIGAEFRRIENTKS